MTREEIVEQRKELQAKMKKAKAEVRHIKAEYKKLEQVCAHPAQYTHSIYGEFYKRCPDCGRDVLLNGDY